jgi:gluconate 2-dehydrogenase
MTDWLGSDVHHATLGILGMGRIGQAVARRALGFDMKVIYHNRSRLPSRQGSRLPRHLGGQGDPAARGGFPGAAAALFAESHHIIGAAELAQMKPTAHLINVARGGIVDDAALISALRQRRLSGAALDVFEGEPKLNPGFLELDNVTLTPHIGSGSRATRMAMAMTAANNLIAALSGQRPPKPAQSRT